MPQPPVNVVRRAWWQMHACVLLWGSTAVLGKLISLPAVDLVWWRMLIVAVLLACWPNARQAIHGMPRELVWQYLGIGMLVAVHWLCFYGSVKLANASVAATTLSLACIFVAFIEPLVMRQRINPTELLLGALILPGVALVVGGTPQHMRLGLLLGVLSAWFVAVFGVFNKRLASHHVDAGAMTLLEMTGGCVTITLLLPWFAKPALQWPHGADIPLLLLLCVACTLLPFIMAFQALRHISAFGAQLAVNLEPVYAILLSIVLLHEQKQLDPQFYVGVLIILTVIFSYPLLHRQSVITPTSID